MYIFIRWYSSDVQRVEEGYSTQFYPKLANTFRLCVGGLPFSLGDILWALLIIWLLYKLVQCFIFFWKPNRLQRLKLLLWQPLFKFIQTLAVVYIIFNVCWGINYNRQGIATQLGLSLDEYTVKELAAINDVLVFKINHSKAQLLVHQCKPLSTDSLYSFTVAAYQNVSKKYSFLTYHHPAIKTSLWGWVGNYTGFLGYYNPITGEAQVNTTVPAFTQPFTACHEVAHQLGYAKEMEANFVGYLAASASNDERFKYAVYTDLFTYANRTLYIADTMLARKYQRLLAPDVLKDFKERRAFYNAHRSFMEPIIRFLYSKFLQSNQQPMGILSYDEVTSFIIAYYKKFGTI
ncbi:DUF3810 domain-containing protein [Ferruginibacter yonginensis]|uniref:DUF3810 domain-containing protein n=1 Tax=Ferruginibacter yonginensis TaxID=1310416 RepID=A0ABV8QQD0_9BACT